VPSRFFRKYSLPLADEPNRFDRHSTRVRGQLSGASTSAMAGLSRPLWRPSTTYAGTSVAFPSATAAFASSATSRGLAENCG